LNIYSRGLAALERGDLAEASKLADALDASLWRLGATKRKKMDGDMASDLASNVAGQPAAAEDDPSQVLDLVGTMSLDLRGNLKVAQGDVPGGIKLLQQAAKKEKNLGYSEPPRYYRPEQESIGYAYLKSEQWEKAREAFQAALRQRPKSGTRCTESRSHTRSPATRPPPPQPTRNF
jgi:tetratricopeptide (TPR) repeat protein